MDMMTIRKMVMGQMSAMIQMKGSKNVSFTLGANCSNPVEIANAILEQLPTFKLAFAFVDRDYSETPQTNNQFLWADGYESQFNGFYRYRGNYYSPAQLSTAYDCVATQGTKITIIYV